MILQELCLLWSSIINIKILYTTATPRKKADDDEENTLA
jgi:hypothetical protein